LAARKTSQQKPSSKPVGPRLTKKEYQAVHADVVKTVERLELDLNLNLKDLKQKLNCFCHDVFSPVYGPHCKKSSGD